MIGDRGPGTDGEKNPAKRIILLGASNLTRGISTAVESALLACGGPARFLVAMGHGRSYGMESSFLGRRLPGILQCGLWDALSPRGRGADGRDSMAAEPSHPRPVPFEPLPLESPSLESPSLESPSSERSSHEPIRSSPTLALVTDIGNDILYDVPVDRIVSWIDEVFDRLAGAGARTIVTELPVDNLAALGLWRYRMARSVMFPRCRLTLAEVSARTREVNDRVRASALGRGFGVVAPSIEWFGMDPIHIRWRFFSSAWKYFFSPWSAGVETAPRAVGSARRWLYLHALAPQRRSWFCVVQRRRQPSGALADGSTVALY